MFLDRQNIYFLKGIFFHFEPFFEKFCFSVNKFEKSPCSDVTFCLEVSHKKVKMFFKEVHLKVIDVSSFNTRKNPYPLKTIFGAVTTSDLDLDQDPQNCFELYTDYQLEYLTYSGKFSSFVRPTRLYRLLGFEFTKHYQEHNF